MRQSQSNRRGRGRSRKAQNPLTKNYESNGPDVKIRGTAAHISEKYNSLARDALASSDNVRYENYLQHAEHYNRIIMAAQQAQSGSEEAKKDQTNNDAQDEAMAEAGANGHANQQGGAKKKSGNRRRRSDNGQRADRAPKADAKDTHVKDANGDGSLKASEQNGKALANGHDEGDKIPPVKVATRKATANVDTSADDAAA